jgi:Domain of unknown function (DUF3291)
MESFLASIPSRPGLEIGADCATDATTWTVQPTITFQTYDQENSVMVLVSVTRLRLRSIRYLLAFFWYAIRSESQAKRAPGNLQARTQAKGWLTFWTLTVWENEAAMRQYMLAGAHREAMTKLTEWCDEAALTHWMQDPAIAPRWKIAEQQLAEHGKFTPLKYPSQAHREKRFSF